MRLWHYKLIEALPRSQLLAQWRELNSIYVNKPNHILINYVYDNKPALFDYSLMVINEIEERGYIYRKKHFNEYFKDYDIELYSTETEYFSEHNNEYLEICYWNLREKYIRGQKDFTEECWEKIERICKK